jgi:diguanylate cyclase (GGDEF)-like protein/PAS domain S-box-containing protein
MATVAAVVILVPVLYWAFSAYRAVQSGSDLVDAIGRNFTERASFRDQYFLYREDRARMLWDESKVHSDQLLRAAKSRLQGEADQKAVERIRRSVEETAIVFHRIVDNSRSLKSATGNREVFEELDKRLYSQLLLKAADVRDAISAIQSSSAMQEQQAYRRFTMISYVLALLLATIIVLNAVQIGSLIRRRLLTLHDGANRVVGGNLAYRIESGSGDEFSEIADAINSITEKLQVLTQDLEAKVRSRTAELEQSETRLRSVFNAMSEGFSIQEAVCDEAGKPIDLRFIAANPAFESQTGLKNATTLGHTLRELFPQAESYWIERYGKVALSGEATSFDAEFGPLNKHYQVSAFQIEPGRVGITFMDISERKQHEARQLLVSQRMEVLLKLPAAADGRSETEFLQYGLDQVEALTGSQIAFVHFVNDDQETIELLTWSQATLKDYCTATFDRHYPISQAGIWADALRQRQPVLINDYAKAPGKHGLPEGHARLERLISVPVIDVGLVRMMLGVGNKPQPYSELDVETTRLLAESLWHIVSQRRAEAALRKSQQSLNQAQFIAGIGNYALDLSTGLWESSHALDQLFGIDAAYERSVQGWEELIHPDDRAMMDEHFKGEVLGQRKPFDREYRIQRHNDKELRWVHGLGVLEFDTQGQPLQMHGTIQDITERKIAQEQIQALAFSDPLTGLPNRRLLMDRLEQALTAAARHGLRDALLFIDLDNFKTINDTLGHDKGDLLLKQISQRLLGCVREGDTVARLGGDEFVVLLQNLSSTMPEAAAQAQGVAQKILSALAQSYELEGHGHHSTASIGFTLFGGAQRENIEEPLKRAELAMYEAKAAGRNSLRFFEPEMRTAVATRASLEADLRVAVTRGQFLLYYQAQGGDEARLMGVEALVRWQHPERGLVSPMEFIPVAEASGLILPLGRWVLETACKQLAAWALRPERCHLTMAVNVSARQVRQSGFVQEVLSILQVTGARPERLKLELTESVLLDNVQDIITKMNALKAKGVSFSLDDFGTGYSSLSYLKRLPLDQLKIDQGFVRDILVDPNDAAIAKMVVALADSLGLQVIAEGVETEAQRDFLAKLGCHNYQGYLLSRPLPIQEFEAFVKRA